MKSRSEFEPEISRAAGSIAMVPDGHVTLDGTDEPVTNARMTSRSTQGSWVPEKVKRRWPTREAALRVSGNGGGKKEVGCYTLVLYSARTSFDCIIRIQAHAVIARRRELVTVAEAHPAACEVALDCPVPGTTTTWAFSSIQIADLWGPLEAVYLGVCVVIRRNRHVVLARASNRASHGKRRCSRRDYTSRAVGESTQFPMSLCGTSHEKNRHGKVRLYAQLDKMDRPTFGVIEPRGW